jgi:transposase-like protein
MLTDAREDLTAFTAFPVAHWRKLWSTNPLERLNKEVKRRTNVVGIFPDDAAASDSSARSSSRPTMSGRWPSAATCQKARWPSSPRPGMMQPDPRR